MGRLTEQTIPSFYQGISQQPETVRYPSQVSDALNVTFSVETGGFEKRLGTTVLGSPGPFGDSSEAHRLHAVEKEGDPYVLIHRKDRVTYFNLGTGDTQDIVIDNPADSDWLYEDPDNYEFLTVVDYTFVLKKTQSVDLLDAEAPATGRSYASMQLTRGITEGTYKVRIKYRDEEGTLYTHAGSGTTTTQAGPDELMTDVATNLEADLTENSPYTWFISQDKSFLYVYCAEGIDFSVETLDPHGDAGFVVTRDRVKTTTELTAKSFDGHKVEVRSATEEEGYWMQFHTNAGELFGQGTWEEATPDGTKTRFDPSTMPRVIKRQPDGTLRLERIDWNEKKAGGDTLVPPPDFVGRFIHDIVFKDNRLGFVFDESVYFSASGDFFRFWPASAAQYLDDDPFGLTSTATNSSKFSSGVNFRRSLYLMSQNSQHEVYGSPFTANTSKIAMATRYPAYADVRPAVVGDELYFLSKASNRVSLYAYRYSESSTSEIATDVSKHAPRLMSGNPRQLVSNPLSDELYVLTDGDPTKLYVHRFFYNGNERAQSAWTVYDFNARDILSVAVINGQLILLTRRGSLLYIETMDTTDVPDEYFERQPRMDRKRLVRGTYDTERRMTIFNVAGIDQNVRAFTTRKWAPGQQEIEVPLRRVADDTYEADGLWDVADVLFGEVYDSEVTLSPVYLRDGNGGAKVTGRLQLRRMALRYASSGHFKVRTKPKGRTAKEQVFTPRKVSVASNTIGKAIIEDGTFRVSVRSRAEDVEITIKSDSYLPFAITSATWTGFYNEISRQG